jgi:hypothetical protein
MRTRMLFAAALFSLVLAPLSLTAQEAPDQRYREGFWIGFGLGPAHAQLNCSGCGALPPSDPLNGGAGFSGYLALGGTLRPDLLIGGEISVYSKEGGQQTWSEREVVVASTTVVLQYYPAGDSRFFVKGGAGLGHYYVQEYYLNSFWGRTASSDREYETSGFAVKGGAGYDLLLTRRIALVPSANAVQILASGEKNRAAGASRGPSNPRYVEFGVGLHWY